VNQTAHELRQDLLSRLAEPGVDLDRAAQRVAATRAGRRRRRRNRWLASAGVVAIVGFAVLASVVVSGEGEELVADGASTTTTEAPDDTDSTETDAASSSEALDASEGDGLDESDPSVLEAVPVEPVPARPPALVTPEPPPAVTAAPVPVAPPATEEPLVLEVRPSTTAPVAGEAVAFEVAWLDADHVGGAPMIRVDWGDPLLQPTMVGADELDCRGGGRPVGSVERAEVRFASPGPRTVRVEVTACDGPTGTPQRTVAASGVTVAAPTHRGAPARTFVAHAATGVRLPGPLDLAVASFRPPEGLAVGLGQRRPVLDQRAVDGVASVVVVPGAGAGRLELAWPGQPCRASSELGASPFGSARLAPLTISC